jgi:hypothetical protein
LSLTIILTIELFHVTELISVNVDNWWTQQLNIWFCIGETSYRHFLVLLTLE